MPNLNKLLNRITLISIVILVGAGFYVNPSIAGSGGGAINKMTGSNKHKASRGIRSRGVVGTWGYPGVAGPGGYPGVAGYGGYYPKWRQIYSNRYSGIDGKKGYPGISGNRAYSGISANDGYPGVSGNKSYSGISGSGSYPGISGSEGYPGIPGD